MASLESTALLLAAAADLSVVRLIRDAIRTADLSAGAAAGHCDCIGHPADRYEPRPVVHPTPHYDPRPVLHPTPFIAARPVLHPTPRVEPEPPIQGAPTHKPFAVQPPWKTLPFPAAEHAPAKVKVVVKPPDTHHKGLLIDFFC